MAVFIGFACACVVLGCIYGGYGLTSGSADMLREGDGLAALVQAALPPLLDFVMDLSSSALAPALVALNRTLGAAVDLPTTAAALACVNATLANGLQGVDLDFEPQAVAGLAAAPIAAFFAALADALAAHGLLLTIDVGPGCGAGTDCASLARIGNLTQVNTEDGFNVGSVADFAAVVAADLPSLGAGKWAPGFEPGNLGVDTYASILRYAAASATGVRFSEVTATARSRPDVR
jgi:hypothetical protein